MSDDAIINTPKSRKPHFRSPLAHQPPVLTVKLVQGIFKLRASGLSYRQIAKELKIGWTTAYFVIKAAETYFAQKQQ